jgi:hypothetical protein
MKGRVTLEAAGLRLEAELENEEELKRLPDLPLVQIILRLKEVEVERQRASAGLLAKLSAPKA